MNYLRNVWAGSLFSIVVLANSASATPTPQSITNLTVTSVSDDDASGEVVIITVSQAVVSGCTSTLAYALRDAAIVKGGLALIMSAFVTGKAVNLYVTGACDTPTGYPLVINVTIH